jgi:hypothetical protein
MKNKAIFIQYNKAVWSNYGESAETSTVGGTYLVEPVPLNEIFDKIFFENLPEKQKKAILSYFGDNKDISDKADRKQNYEKQLAAFRIIQKHNPSEEVEEIINTLQMLID